MRRTAATTGSAGGGMVEATALKRKRMPVRSATADSGDSSSVSPSGPKMRTERALALMRQRLHPRYILTMIGILSVKLTFPFAVLMIIGRQLTRWWLGRLSSPRAILLLMLRHTFRLGVTVEAYFFLYYLYQKWRLSELDVHLEPLHQDSEAQRRARAHLLERCLACFDEIGLGRPLDASADAPESGATKPARLGSPSSADALLQNLSERNERRRSKESLLRNIAPTGSLLGLSRTVSEDLKRRICIAPAINPGVPSAEDLLRWRDDGDWQDEFEDEEVLLLSFKRAEIASWFYKAPIQNIRRGNIAEWLAEYFFHNSTPERLRRDPAQAAELDVLVEKVVRWARLEDTCGDGKEANPEVRCMRLLRDPLPSTHRPFWVYLITHLIIPRLTQWLLKRFGFRRYRAGAMIYWRRQGDQSDGSPSSPSPVTRSRPAPIVFVHGLGIGMLPYIKFIKQLVRRHPECDVLCVDMPHIQMRPCEQVPSAREMCACIGDMLHAWGHSTANFVGHSFGTLVIAWMVRYTPSSIQSVSFLDPVCFLLCKSDLIFNALYNHDATDLYRKPGEWLLGFLVFRELYICHTLTRNFFWEQSNLFPEDLHGIPAMLLLGGRDPLVPAHSVRQMFHAEAERQRLALEAGRSGGDVVIQSGLVPRRPVLPVASKNGADENMQAPAPARICFVKRAEHGQFWKDEEILEECLQQVTAIIRHGVAHASVRRQLS
eukprot:TRINITY_DN17620_c0_g1_i1.p1 TRINITY_DN17620_c0_g1~~TRINITY_DN17620_c0_g1_i1.p1  ORF type:complete len:717 (+),score=128.00 TRINITY_DN17620_c0_g1_i1:110-2260(+)